MEILKVNASSLSRVMSCAGSLFFKDLPKSETSDAASQGIAAAEVLEMTLKGQPIDTMTHDRRGTAVDDDMRFYANGVKDLIDKIPYKDLAVEQKCHWTTESGIQIKAKPDVSYVYNDSLYVDDYKYGYGLIDPKENWQLLAYAIGEVIRRNQSFRHIVLTIHQPRPHHEDGPSREWMISYEKLLEYKDTIEHKMYEISKGYKELQANDACKYCDAATSCPAFNKAYFRGVEVIHDFIQDNLENDELSFQLDLVNRIEDLVKIRKDSLQHLAIDRIKRGLVVPNYICKESYGNREWSPGVTPDVIKMLTGKDVVEKKILSPAKSEKLGVPKELVKNMTTRRFRGTNLTKIDPDKFANKIFGESK